MLTLKKLASDTTPEAKFGKMITEMTKSIGELNSLDKTMAKDVLAVETINDVKLANINTTMNDVGSIIKAGYAALGIDDLSPEEYNAQATAAAQSTIMAFNPQEIIGQKVTPSPEGENHRSFGASHTDLSVRHLAKECYKHRNIDRMASCTCSYNMRAGAPDEFVRNVAPLFMINSGEAGLQCVANLLYIQDDAMHSINGDLIDFNRRSLTQASIDSSILGGASNKIFPIVRNPESLHHFVNPTNVASHQVKTHGEVVDTAPLLIDTPVNLIGISQLDGDLVKGKANLTDQLDAAVSLKSLYLGMGTFDSVTGIYAEGALKMNTLAFSTASFKMGHSGSCAVMNLTFETDSYRINKDTKLTDGSSIGDIHPDIVANSLKIYCSVRASGSVNIEKGDLVVYGNEFRVNAIYDINDVELPLDVAPQIAIVDALEGGRGGCRIIGYDVEANLTNLNHRRRGDLVGEECYTEEMFVPLLPPITCVRPVGSENDSSQVSKLVKLLHIRMNNDAVKMLNDTSDILEDYVMNGVPGIRPDILGIGRLFVTPTFLKRPLDVAAEIMGISSSERASDVKAVLINAVRDMAIRLYIQSGLEAARTGMNNGVRTKPTIVIATDSHIAANLYESGDNRLLGDMFNFRVVTSPNNEMKGKLFMFFQEASTGTGSPSCTTFAATAHSPEVVFNLDIPRDGGISNELGVYPRYKIFPISPILGRINVSRLSEALGRSCPADCDDQ